MRRGGGDRRQTAAAVLGLGLDPLGVVVVHRDQGERLARGALERLVDHARVDALAELGAQAGPVGRRRLGLAAGAGGGRLCCVAADS